MSNIEVAFMGVVVKDAQPKVSQTGKKYLRMNMRIGDGDACQWANVTVFGTTADEIAEHATKGMPLYVEGRLTLDSWVAPDGTPRSGLSVAAWRCRPPEIGRRKAPKVKASQSSTITQRESSPPFDDPIDDL
jgi:single-strand DNA-binding protein